jgi:TRAP-type C4-dicarboxylate transport system substrate-binding protein
MQSRNRQTWNPMMDRRSFLKGTALLGGSMMVIGFPGMSFSQKTTKWRFYMYTPPGHHYTRLMAEMAKEIAQRTNNEFQITVVTAGEVPYNPTQALDIVRDGFVDGAESVPDFVAGSLPILNLTNLPMLLPSLEELETGMKAFEPIVKEELQKMKQDLLYWHFASLKSIFGRGKPVETLTDLRGKRIRAFGLVDSHFVRLLGAIPVALPNTEVPQAMERGVIDAFIASGQFTVGSKWNELIQWAYLLDFTAICCYDTISSSSLQKLPPDQAKVLVELRDTYQKRWHTMVTDLEKKGREKMADAGVKLVAPTAGDREKAQELAEPYWGEWAQSTGPKAIQALQQVRKAVHK